MTTKNDIEIYSTNNEGKSVIEKYLIEPYHKYMTSIKKIFILIN